MRIPSFLGASVRAVLVLAVGAVGAAALLQAPVAHADDRPVQFKYDEPGYSIRIYEVFQQGPKLMMQARTTRAIERDVIRNVKVGEVWPPESEPPLEIGRSRGHVDYFASYWRDDLTYDRGHHEVEVWETEASDKPGVSKVRVRLVERPEHPMPMMGHGGGMTATSSDDMARYGVRLYEVYQKGADLVLQERTTRAFGPQHGRDLTVGVAWPPEGGPALEIYKNRDHVAFLGSYWEQGGSTDFGAYEVEVWEDGEPTEAGTAMVRARIVPRTTREEGAKHIYKNPVRASRRRGES